MTFERIPDFTVTYERGFALLWALSDKAKAWAIQYVPQRPGERIHASTAVALDRLEELAREIRKSGMTI